jgi:predicted dehydrogenase
MWGGVLLDMGYHIFDVISRFFGRPKTVHSIITYSNPISQTEQLEDSSSTHMEFEENLKGSVVLHRHSSRKKERFEILGTKGRMVIDRDSVFIEDREGCELFSYIQEFSKEKELMFTDLATRIRDRMSSIEDISLHQNTIEMIEGAYFSAWHNKTYFMT